jgi:hypothetical protein
MLPLALTLHVVLELFAGIVGCFVDPVKILPNARAIHPNDTPWLKMFFFSIISNALAALIVILKAPKSHLKTLSIGFAAYHVLLVAEMLLHPETINTMLSILIIHALLMVLFIFSFVKFKEPAKSKTFTKVSTLLTVALNTHTFLEIIPGTIFYFIHPQSIYPHYALSSAEAQQVLRIVWISMICQGIISFTVIAKRNVVNTKLISVSLLAYHIMIVSDMIFSTPVGFFEARTQTTLVHLTVALLFIGGILTSK